jgi:hypothetical protein
MSLRAGAPVGIGIAKAPTLSALSHLLVFFLRTYCLTFGSGLVIVPFLEKDLVQQTGWLNGSEFLVAGLRGSRTSTIEIFLPSVSDRGRRPDPLPPSRQPKCEDFVKRAYALAIGTIVGACVPHGQIARRLAHFTYSRRRCRGLAPLKSKQSTAHRRDCGHWVDHLPNPSAHMGLVK